MSVPLVSAAVTPRFTAARPGDPPDTRATGSDPSQSVKGQSGQSASHFFGVASGFPFSAVFPARDFVRFFVFRPAFPAR